MIIPIKNNYKLSRDLNSMAIISTDLYGYLQAKEGKRIRKEWSEKIKRVDEALNNILEKQ